MVWNIIFIGILLKKSIYRYIPNNVIQSILCSFIIYCLHFEQKSKSILLTFAWLDYSRNIYRKLLNNNSMSEWVS